MLQGLAPIPHIENHHALEQSYATMNLKKVNTHNQKSDAPDSVLQCSKHF